MKVPALLLAFALAFGVADAARAVVAINEDFESLPAGTILRTVPGWFGSTNSFKVDNAPGLAAGGSQYLTAPSLSGPGNRQRIVWFDASGAFNSRPTGDNVVVGDVQMFVPNVTDSTYGGMFMFDQLGQSIGVIGVDMQFGTTLTDASSGVNNIAVNLGQYNDFKMFADFNSGLVTYQVNGTDIGFRQMSPSQISVGFSDFDFYNNGFNATASIPFRYDNYSVAFVPEPETFALLVSGFYLLGLAVRRRPRVAPRRAPGVA